MQLDITFRHLEHTESIDNKIREKLDRVSRKFSGNTHFKWTSWVEHDEHISTLHAFDNGKEFFVKAAADSLYKTIDLVIQKMESQLEHHAHG